MIDLALLPWIVTVVGAAAAPAVIGLRALGRRIGRKRNARATCGRCKAHFGDADDPEVFVIDGIFVCEGCAEKARKSYKVVLWGVGGFVLLAPVAAAVGFLTHVLGGGWGWWEWPHLIPLLSPPFIAYFAARWEIRRMVRANRAATSLTEEEADIELGPGDESLLRFATGPLATHPDGRVR
jgi:hypothetical protein